MGTPLSTADLRRLKLHQVLRRHEECRIAFQELKSQIQFGLSEAKDVFNSLSVPLMTLVGLKTEEMAEEGRSNSILVDRHLHYTSFPRIHQQSNESASGGFVFNGDLLRKPDEDGIGIYSAKARDTCEELLEKQKQNVRKLIHLLRAIEIDVNSRHVSIRQTVDSHRDSLRSFLKKAASFLFSLHRQGQAYDSIVQLAVKVLVATFDHVGSALESVEDEVDSLVKGLSEEMCEPLVDHARSLCADVKNGAPARMAALVGDMERVLRDRRVAAGEMERVLGEARLEVEVARKRARVEEEQKLQAVRVSREYQEKFRGLREFVVESFLKARKGTDQVNLLLGSADLSSGLMNQKSPTSPKDEEYNTTPRTMIRKGREVTRGGRAAPPTGPVTRSTNCGTPSPRILPGSGGSPFTVVGCQGPARKRNCSSLSPLLR